MFDGDGDRLGVHSVHPIPFDAIGGLLVDYNKFKNVCYDVRCNFRIPRFLKNNNINSYETKVGHSYVKQTMREHDLEFGFELSGHCYYKEHMFTDTPLLAIRDLVLLLESQDKLLDTLVEPYWGMWASEEVNFGMNTQLEMDMICNNIKNLFSDIDNVNTLDGTKVVFKDGSWILARKSGTQNVVRIIVEGTTNEQRDTLLSKAQSFIEGCGGKVVETLPPEGPVIKLATL
jgi:phosphomannomutase